MAVRELLTDNEGRQFLFSDLAVDGLMSMIVRMAYDPLEWCDSGSHFPHLLPCFSWGEVVPE